MKLFENEMEGAQLVLAAKAVLADLQKMAETVAKMEANSIMPLYDGIRQQFGQNTADKMDQVSTSGLREILNVIKATKDEIGGVVMHMEHVVTGKGPANDMASNAGVDEFEDQVDIEPSDSADDVLPEPDISKFSDASVGRNLKEFVSDEEIISNLLNDRKKGISLKESMNEIALRYDVDVEDVVDIAKQFTRK